MGTILQFGKYKGEDIEEVPDDYVDFMVKNNEEGLRMWKDERSRRDMEARAAALKVDGSFMAQIIKAGYTKLQTEVGVDQIKLQLAYEKMMDSLTQAAAKP